MELDSCQQVKCWMKSSSFANFTIKMKVLLIQRVDSHFQSRGSLRPQNSLGWKEHWRPLSSNPLPQTGTPHLDLAAQSTIQPGTEHFHGWGTHSFSGQPVPGIDTEQGRRKGNGLRKQTYAWDRILCCAGIALCMNSSFVKREVGQEDLNAKC